MNDTSWIREGTEVVVYSYGGGTGVRGPWALNTTISKVNKKTFKVADYDRLFQIDDQTYRGGTWDASVHVIPLDDPRVPGLLRAEVSRRLDRAAQRAVDAWERDRSMENTRKAIQALTRLYRDQEIIARHQTAQEG